MAICMHAYIAIKRGTSGRNNLPAGDEAVSRKQECLADSEKLHGVDMVEPNIL